jgi:hypothetical protein
MLQKVDFKRNLSPQLIQMDFYSFVSPLMIFFLSNVFLGVFYYFDEKDFIL